MTVTAAEIAQQPDLWRECAALALERQDAVTAFVKAVPADARVVLTGAGTSAFIGQILAPGLAQALGRPVTAIPTTDLVSSPGLYLSTAQPTLLVSFARSGNSPESLAATSLATELGSAVRHLVITCDPGGELATEHAARADSLVLTMPARANDAGLAMTSSFTTMLLSAQLTLGAEVDVPRLAAAGEAVLSQAPSRVAAIAGGGFDRVVYLGSGPLKGLAQEAALKVLELTAGRVATWYDSALGFRHGPKAVLDDRTHVVVLTSSDRYTRRYDDDIVAELSGQLRPGSVTVLDTSGAPASGTVWSLPQLDDLDDAQRAVVLALPAQALALEFSLALGLTPDNPFPSGQVSRVVQGVRIHPLS